MRVFLTLPLLLLLTSCTTTYIPGLDRVLFPNSSAKIGPVVAVGDENSVNDSGVTSPVPDNKTVSEPPASISDNKPDSKPGIEAQPEPAVQTADLNVATLPEDSEVKELAQRTKREDANKLRPPKKVTPKISSTKENRELVVDYGTVTGKVVLLGEKGKLLPAAGTLITLAPKTVVNEAQDRPSKVHVIDMQDKEYQPRYSAINAGDQLVFVNKDNIQHNVFSSSGSNAFDLGTYGSGLKRAVTLKEPGVVKIYCNIHSEMATFVAVGNPGLSVKADDQGGYKIDKVLPGTYEVTIWNIRGETKQVLEVKANETSKLVNQIDTIAFRAKSHKNKFGGDYSKNSALFEDEFY